MDNTKSIPDAIKPNWRAVFYHLRNERDVATAERFLQNHADAPLTCRKCGEIAIPAVSISTMPAGRFHIAANCASCNAWFKWLKFDTVGGAICKP